MSLVPAPTPLSKQRITTTPGRRRPIKPSRIASILHILHTRTQMKGDELPVYPTPKQVSYAALAQPARKSETSGLQGHRPPVQQKQRSLSSQIPQHYASLPQHVSSGHKQGTHPQPMQQPIQTPHQPPQIIQQHPQSHPHNQGYQSRAYLVPAPPSQQPQLSQQYGQFYRGPPPQAPQAQYQDYQDYQRSEPHTPTAYYGPSSNAPPSNQYVKPYAGHGSRQQSYESQTPNASANYAGEARSPNLTRKKPPLTANPSKESLVEPKTESKQRLEAEIRATFDRVDTNWSGRISQRELSSALVNFDKSGFLDTALLLMIKLYSTPGSSPGLNFEQFMSLWKFLTAYKKLFVAADAEKSGDISFGKFQMILEQIGYKLNVDVVLLLFLKFVNRDPDHDSSAVGKLKFDAFIEASVYIRKLTDIFKQYDKDFSGVATIKYLDFLMAISNLS